MFHISKFALNGRCKTIPGGNVKLKCFYINQSYKKLPGNKSFKNHPSYQKPPFRGTGIFDTKPQNP